MTIPSKCKLCGETPRIKEPIYEWQGRAYMILWDKEEFELAYCMVSTPEELIGYDDERLHLVDHIDPTLCITKKLFKRDKEKAELLALPNLNNDR